MTAARRTLPLLALALACDARPEPTAPPTPSPTPTPVAAAPAPPPTPPPVVKPADPWIDIDTDGDARWVAFRSNDAVLATRDSDGAALGLGEYDVATGKRLAEIRGPEESGPPAAFSAAAGLLAFASEDGVVVRKLGAADPDRVLKILGPDALAFSPAGDRLAATHAEPGVVASVEVFDVTTGKRLHKLTPFGRSKLEYDSGWHLVPAYFPGGDRMALLFANDTPAEAHLASGPANAAKGWTRLELSHDDDPFGSAPSLGLALAISPDGATIAAGNFDARVHFLAPGATTTTPVAIEGGEPTALAFDPDGRWLIAAADEGTLHVLAMPARTSLARVAAPPQCHALAVSPDRKHVAGGCDGGVRIWRVTWPDA